MDLKNAVAVVTGGNGGLGQRICHALAAQGVHVAVLYARSAGDAQTVANSLKQSHGVKAEAIACDVTDPKSVQAMVDGVVTNASAGSTSSSTTPPSTRRSPSRTSTTSRRKSGRRSSTSI